MKTRLASFAALIALVFVCSLARADAGKPVTLTGDLMCGMCTLKQTAKCSDVLVVKEGDKQTQYNVTFNDGSKEHHVCSGKKHVQVTGVVGEQNGKKTLAVSKIEEIK